MDERRQLFAPAVALEVSVEMAEVMAWLPNEVHAKWALMGTENDEASHGRATTGRQHGRQRATGSTRAREAGSGDRYRYRCRTRRFRYPRRRYRRHQHDSGVVHGRDPARRLRPSGNTDGVAPVVYTLWQRFLRFDPGDPIWPNRDRFVLSEGHASALLWSLLHLSGVRAVDPDYEILDRAAVTLDDLKTFRQLGSRCPGHPEYRWTSGVEATTGPLGQGVATSVGMAIAGRWLAERYNRDAMTLFDFDVYALAGDGCMMEGVSGEAASLAGHLRLANLCWIYDSNRVTIEGHTDITFTEDVAARFIAYGWNVTTVADANDIDSIERACARSRPRASVPR